MALAGVSFVRASRVVSRVFQHQLLSQAQQQPLVVASNTVTLPQLRCMPVRSMRGTAVTPVVGEQEKKRKQKPAPGTDSAEKPKTKKPLKSPEITLIMPDEHVTSDTLENAEKIAKRRDLKLVKIVDFDTKTEKPLYRLMSKLQFFQEESKAKAQRKKEKGSEVKDEKLFLISSKISEHDLSFKLNQMLKLLKKKHEVQVFISQDGNAARAEELAKEVEEELKEGAEKKNQVKKMTTLKLYFVPKLEQAAETDDKDKAAKDDATSDKPTTSEEKKKTKVKTNG